MSSIYKNTAIREANVDECYGCADVRLTVALESGDPHCAAVLCAECLAELAHRLSEEEERVEILEASGRCQP